MPIDLRSDTLTQPTEEMRAAMAAARVGDDVFGEDPSVRELEDMVAELLGHEAGLFCVSGSLANVLGVAAHVHPGQEVLCDAGAHIARAEMGAHGALSGVTMRTWVTPSGVTVPAVVADLLSPDAGPYLVSTACVAVENTHNFGGGTIQPWSTLTQVSTLCRKAGVALHLDGARLWNAAVATGVALSAYGSLFDTVSVCLSKGLGAPVGSVLVGTAETIAAARVRRKRLGAGWRQAGSLAAAGSYAVSHQMARLADDHAAARGLVAALRATAGERGGGVADPPTNIVLIPTGDRPARAVAAAAAERDVLVTAIGPRAVRAVTHLDVSQAAAEEGGAIVGALLATG
ncbi:MAG: threonine aldolase family protein [Propioniciclava sp.]